MPDNSGEDTVTSSTAAAGVNAEMKQEIQKVVMGIFKDAVPRLVKQAVSDSMPAVLEKFAEEAVKHQPEKKEPEEKGDGERRSPQYKALEDQFKQQLNELRQQLQKRDEALEQKERDRVDALMRGSVREALAGQLGADSPHLDMVMDSFYDKRQRFVPGDDGAPLVRFKSEYGSDYDHLPLKEGVKKLVEGELKHLIPAKTQNLPPSGGVRRGNPVPSNGASGPGPLDRIMNDIASQAARAAADPTQK